MTKPYRLVARERKLLLDLLAALVAQKSFENEVRAIEFCEKFLKKIKVRSQKFSCQKDRPNLVWSLGSRSTSSGQGGPEILIAAHADTVPPGENWRSDPFKLIRKKDFLIGRGVVDNKAPLAGLLVATQILQKFEKDLAHKITFAAIADEECGNKFGLDFLLAKNVFHKLAGAIVPDSCGQNREIEIAEKGVLQIRVRAFGQQGHGSMPAKSKNAIFILKDFLRQIRKLKFARRTKLLTPATIAVTSFHAGAATNIIPGQATATLDIRFPPSESKKDLLAKIKKLADAESKKWRVPKFQVEILQDLPSSETAENSSLVIATKNAIKKISGQRPKIIGMPAFTLAGALRSRGVPTVAFGPGKLEECHRANEKIRAAEVVEFTEILFELLRNLSLK
ncbi:MAG: M20/M25/M40 family metallo-hydrolase [Patescibacteria group bacterium]